MKKQYRSLLQIEILLIALSPFLPLLVQGQLIPSTNRTDWTPGVMTGVPGGIPNYRTNLIDVTQSPFNADNSGTVDASAAIQAAINTNTTHTNDVIYLPAGTYKVGSTISLTRNGITMRGAGTNLTVMNFVNGAELNYGQSGDYQWNYPSVSNTVTAGLTSGSSNLTVADTSGFTVGHVVQVSLQNNAAMPVISVSGFNLDPFNKPMQMQKVRIVSKTATVLTVWPPLYTDYSALTARVYDSETMCQSNGLENLFLEFTNSTSPYGLYWQQCYACWASNVVIHFAANRNMTIYDSLNLEIRHCTFDGAQGGGSDHAGLLYNQNSGGLIEDNILINVFPDIQVNGGSSGNVFAYNFILNKTNLDGLVINHGPHNAFNLYEGNICNTLKSDGYFGSDSQESIYRNWITGEYTGGGSKLSFGYAMVANRFSRYFQLVGNVIGETGMTVGTNGGVILGNPNIGNGSSSGTAPPWVDGCTNGGATTLSISGTTATISGGTFLFNSSEIYGTDNTNSGSYNWQLVYPSSAGGSYFANNIVGFTDSRHVTVGTSDLVTNASFQIVTGPGGYQELDTNVAATINRLANWNFNSNGIPSVESIGTNMLPDSMYLSSKPAYFGTLTYPPIQSTNANNATNLTYYAIPAGVRFMTGNDPTNPVLGGGSFSGTNFQFTISGGINEQVTVEATADFVTWTSLGSVTLSGGSYNFVDSGARSLAQRFYATKEGNVVSSNTYGFVNLTIAAGVGTITLIANQLNNSSGNTVGALLQNVPNSTKVEKFIAATQSWGPVSFYSALSNTWSAGGASFTMNPGEGILVQNHVATNFTVTFIGDVPKAPQVNSGIPGTSGQFAMISSIVPLSTNLNGMAFPAVNGDVASRWNVGTQQYDTNTFSSGAWSPLVPTPNVGEAFFITSGTSSSRTWTENVNISPP